MSTCVKSNTILHFLSTKAPTVEMVYRYHYNLQIQIQDQPLRETKKSSPHLQLGPFDLTQWPNSSLHFDYTCGTPHHRPPLPDSHVYHSHWLLAFTKCNVFHIFLILRKPQNHVKGVTFPIFSFQ